MNNPKTFIKICDCTGTDKYSDLTFRTEAEAIDYLRTEDESPYEYMAEQSLEFDTVAGIDCPLCGEPIPVTSFGDGATYIWSCKEACPFVGFEMITDNDIKNLTNYLKR